MELEIQELKGGITNKLYRVKANGDFVLRIYGERTELFIDRENEMEVMKLLEPFKIAPRLIKYLPEKRITVIEYIEGNTLKNADFLKEHLWKYIIRPIKIMHESGVMFSKAFNPLTEIKGLFKKLQDINVNYPEFNIEGIIKILDKINETIDPGGRSFVPCHNDLLAENFLFTGDSGKYREPMFLIDFEYAGMSSRYYDIADLFQEILVPRKIEQELLYIYWEGKNMEYNIYTTNLYKPFPDIFWFLWSLIQQNVSTIDFDYYNYGKAKYKNAKKNINFIRQNYNLRI